MFKYSVPVFLGLLLVALPALPALPAPVTAGLTLGKIADLSWVGHPPEQAYWGYRGRRIYYWRERGNRWQVRGIAPVRDLYAIDVASGAVQRVPDNELGTVPAPGGAYNLAHTLKVFIRDDNVFVRDLKSGALRQLTRDGTRKTDASFMADGARVQWHEGNAIYLYALRSGTLSLAADIRLSDNPDEPKPPENYLQAEQPRLFEFLSQQQANQRAGQAQQALQVAANDARAPAPWYLGDKARVIRSSLSPDGEWLALVTIPAAYQRGRPGVMPDWITSSGYVEALNVHTYAGLNPPPAQSVLMLNLKTHTSFPLDVTQLPGIKDDPLAALRKSAIAWDVKHGIPETVAQDSVKTPAIRAVSVRGIEWSDNGKQLAVMFRANDNKDRWIASVDFAAKTLITQNRLTDPAWINGSFNAFGWLHDNHTLWYLSEATNYSQLYLKDIHAAAARELTRGNFEVSDPVLTRDDHYFFVVANRKAPGVYGIYRVNSRTGDMQAVTDLGGTSGPQPSFNAYGVRTRELPGFALSPDGRDLLVYHSTLLTPPEIWVVGARPHGAAKQITRATSEPLAAAGLIAPSVVQVPSTHVSQPIYARLYLPPGYTPAKTWPAALNIHEDGYVQDVYQGWPFDLQETLFSMFLAEHGYLVLDMDYRGSAGYGRDWRTAIYQHAGHPEVQDIEDGVHWLEQKWHVSPEHLGVWGHSYGGFLTYMVMFRRPDLFAAGAALSPVGDWADYNDGYTSDILNRPNIDPQAYYESSAINYADQLKHPLLILDGLEDDNVFFLDTVHMVEKLQESENPNFDVMFYPTEHHNFRAPYSWLDEYRRIWRWFQSHVSPGRAGATIQ